MFHPYKPGDRPRSPSLAPAYPEEYLARPPSLLMPALRPEDFQSRSNTTSLLVHPENDSEDHAEFDSEYDPEYDTENELEDEIEDDLEYDFECDLEHELEYVSTIYDPEYDLEYDSEYDAEYNPEDDLEDLEDLIKDHLEYDSEYESEDDVEHLEDDLEDDLEHSPENNPTRPDSPPLPQMRFENYPPLRGTGLGKTAVPIYRQNQVSKSKPENAASYATGDLVQLKQSRSVMGPPPTPKLSEARFGNSGNAARVYPGMSHVAPPPLQKRRRVESVTSTENQAKVTAGPSELGRPPKRPRLIDHFTVSKQRSERDGDGEPGVDVHHTYDHEKAARQTIEELLLPAHNAMRRPRYVEKAQESPFEHSTYSNSAAGRSSRRHNVTSEQIAENMALLPVGSDLHTAWLQRDLWARSQ